MTFFCAKNIFSSHLAIMATGSANPACETSQVLLAGAQVVFFGDLHFHPIYRLTLLKMSEIILTGRKKALSFRKDRSEQTM